MTSPTTPTSTSLVVAAYVDADGRTWPTSYVDPFLRLDVVGDDLPTTADLGGAA